MANSQHQEFINIATEVHEMAEVVGDKVENVSDNVESVSHNVESDKVEIASDKVENFGDRMDKISDWAENVGDRMENISEKVERISDKAENVVEKVESTSDKAETVNDKSESVSDKAENVDDRVESITDNAETVDDKPEIVNGMSESVSDKVESLSDGTETCTTEHMEDMIGHAIGTLHDSDTEFNHLFNNVTDSMEKLLKHVTHVTPEVFQDVCNVSSAVEKMYMQGNETNLKARGNFRSLAYRLSNAHLIHPGAVPRLTLNRVVAALREDVTKLVQKAMDTSPPLANEVEALGQDVSELKIGVSELNDDVCELTRDFSELQHSVSVLNHNLSGLNNLAIETCLPLRHDVTQLISIMATETNTVPRSFRNDLNELRDAVTEGLYANRMSMEQLRAEISALKGAGKEDPAP